MKKARSLNELYVQMSGESIGSSSNNDSAKLIEFKKQIASAITDMGVVTSENADANTMASNIRNISSKLIVYSCVTQITKNNTKTNTITIDTSNYHKCYFMIYIIGNYNPSLNYATATTSDGIELINTYKSVISDEIDIKDMNEITLYVSANDEADV